jgi:hypothetical protein
MAEERKTEIIEEAILLRDQKEYEASNDLLLKLAKAYPDDASINYQCAWSFDLLGHEEKAVSYYENAIRLRCWDWGAPTGHWGNTISLENTSKRDRVISFK